MNILILANNDISLYKNRKELIDALLARGDQVSLALPYGKFIEQFIQMGCKFYDVSIDRRGKNPVTDLKLMIHYYQIIQKVKPDQVLLYTIKPNLYGGIVCRLKKIPFIINITGLGTVFQKEGITKKYIIKSYQIVCNSVSKVLFENKENQQTFINNNIVAQDKTIQLNGAGVNLQEYAYCDYPDEKELHFLFVGRIMREKGINELLAVAESLKEKYSNIVFDIAGWLEENYEEKINAMQNQGIIKYWGFQEDIRPLIRQAHCIILPSYHEGMANILLEAAAMGRPLITSNIHGCKEAVWENKNGYLVEPADSTGLYDVLEDFIRKSFYEHRKMGMVSREYMEANFNRDHIVKQTLEHL